MNGSTEWTLRVMTADAQSLHSADLPPDRGVWLMIPTRPALVLGSSQSADDVDAAFCSSRGLDVARRRSGGGAVLVDSTASVWIDVVIPRTDPMWVDDVGRAMHFVGRAWSDVLAGLGMTDLVVNEGPHTASDWSKQLCVAGRGTGEVFTAAGAKIVGISQRRTRDFARFQCIAYVAWAVESHLGAIPTLREDPARVARLVATIPAIEPADLAARLVSALSTR